jgi:hypothetical protein
MTQEAISFLYDNFANVFSDLTNAREKSSIRALYSYLTPTNFSRDVLTKCPEKLAVLAVSEVGWSDWGSPQRSGNFRSDRYSCQLGCLSLAMPDEAGLF